MPFLRMAMYCPTLPSPSLSVASAFSSSVMPESLSAPSSSLGGDDLRASAMTSSPSALDGISWTADSMRSSADTAIPPAKLELAGGIGQVANLARCINERNSCGDELISTHSHAFVIGVRDARRRTRDSNWIRFPVPTSSSLAMISSLSSVNENRAVRSASSHQQMPVGFDHRLGRYRATITSLPP
jgi:hypothetical protein